jgi:hypothetical protein
MVKGTGVGVSVGSGVYVFVGSIGEGVAVGGFVVVNVGTADPKEMSHATKKRATKIKLDICSNNFK